MNSMTKKLQQQHQTYIASVKADGGKILTFPAPCCGQDIETPAAPEGDTFNTLAVCINCGESYFRNVSNTSVEAHL